MKERKKIYLGFEELHKKGYIGSNMISVLQEYGAKGNCNEISKHLSLPVEKLSAVEFYHQKEISFCKVEKTNQFDWVLQDKLKTNIKLRSRPTNHSKNPIPIIHLENTRRNSKKNKEKQVLGQTPYDVEAFDILHVVYPRFFDEGEILVCDYGNLQHLLVPTFMIRKGDILYFPQNNKTFFQELVEKQEEIIKTIKSS